jgi:hypothetical protein
MTQSIRKAGTIVKAVFTYFSEERKEEQKIREIGLRKYIEDYNNLSKSKKLGV